MELQRDVALLQEQIKDLQQSQDEKFAALTELARQSSTPPPAPIPPSP